MKKKILFVISAIAIVIVFTFNLSISKGSNQIDIKLVEMINANEAQAEGWHVEACDAGSQCIIGMGAYWYTFKNIWIYY